MYPKGTNKSEWDDQAKEIVEGKVVATPVELISWLQDMNWPGSQTIATYLHSLPNDQIAEAIKTALESNDEMWIYWIHEVWTKEELDSILKTIAV